MGRESWAPIRKRLLEDLLTVERNFECPVAYFRIKGWSYERDISHGQGSRPEFDPDHPLVRDSRFLVCQELRKRTG